MARPPLELHAELVAPDGTRHRWGSERTDPQDIPSGISFASKRFEGFERGSCRLNRPVDRDYPDLGLFDSFTLVGYDASVAYEGMLGQVPRSTPYGIGVETTGWMAHARHQKFREIYVDRDLSRWMTSPTTQRRANLATGAPVYSLSGAAEVRPDPTGGNPSVTLGFPDFVNTAGVFQLAETWYDAGKIPIGEVYRDLLTNNLGGSWNVNLYLAPNALLTTADLFGGAGVTTGTGYVAASDTDRVYAALQLYFAAAFSGTPNNWWAAFRKLAVYGTHGLTKRTVASGEPDGFYASDILKDIAGRFCPRLSTAGVQGTTWPVPHAAWHDRTDPYDAWLELNRYHLWELAVWEDRTLFYEPGDLTDYDWEVRTTDPGVSIDLQGDDTESLFNYAVVQFQNVRTGEQDEVSPATHPDDLRDYSVENPANRNGLDVEFGVTLSDPTDPDSAAQIGRAKLAEANQPRLPGTITFKGHIRDRAGHWQQGWKVRAGDTIAITDWPNNRSRLIGEVEWNHDSLTGKIAVDSTFRRVDAFLDRYGTSLRAAGLGN